MTLSGQKVTFRVTLGETPKSLFGHSRVTLNLNFSGFQGVLGGQHFLTLVVSRTLINKLKATPTPNKNRFVWHTKGGGFVCHIFRSVCLIFL